MTTRKFNGKNFARDLDRETQNKVADAVMAIWQQAADYYKDHPRELPSRKSKKSR